MIDILTQNALLPKGGEVPGDDYSGFNSSGLKSNKLLEVIIVEDSFADFDDISRYLRKMKHYDVRIKRAKTIEDARFSLSFSKFDIAFIDFYLGNESGARLLRELRQSYPTVVPILITGLDDENVQNTALEEGAIGCINKDDMSVRLLETTLRCCIYNHFQQRTLQDQQVRNFNLSE